MTIIIKGSLESNLKFSCFLSKQKHHIKKFSPAAQKILNDKINISNIFLAPSALDQAIHFTQKLEKYVNTSLTP